MNIGIVTTWFERGAAYVSKQYAEVLSKENNIYIFARSGEKYAIGEKEWDSERVHWAKKCDVNISTYIDLKEFELWIKNNNIECVLFNEQHWWQPILYCNEKKIKCGAYIDYYTEETIPFFRNYDFILCNTKRHYDVFKNFEQVFYIPWGTDINLFKMVNNQLVTKDKVTFFHSAGYSPQRKGTEYLLEAFNKLSQKYEGQCQLIIHTQVELEKFNPNINDILQKNSYIKVITKTITAPGLYHLGDVYVYPSVLDGLGLTVAEALSCGLPIIVTDNAPMIEFGNNELRRKVRVKAYHCRKDAYFWPEAEVSVRSLYNQLEYFIIHKNEIPELKVKARKYAVEYLDWSKNAEELNDIFRNTQILEHRENYFQNIRNYEDKITSIETGFKIYDYKLKRIEKEIKKYEGKQIFFYPGGGQTKRILKYVDLENVRIMGIIDRSYEEFANYPIYDLNVLKQYPDAVVIVTSWFYREEILSAIKKIEEFRGIIVNLFQSQDETL